MQISQWCLQAVLITFSCQHLYNLCRETCVTTALRVHKKIVGDILVKVAAQTKGNLTLLASDFREIKYGWVLSVQSAILQPFYSQVWLQNPRIHCISVCLNHLFSITGKTTSAHQISLSDRILMASSGPDPSFFFMVLWHESFLDGCTHSSICMISPGCWAQKASAFRLADARWQPW